LSITKVINYKIYLLSSVNSTNEPLGRNSHPPRSKEKNTYDVKHKMALGLINIINQIEEPLGAYNSRDVFNLLNTVTGKKGYLLNLEKKCKTVQCKVFFI